MNKKDKIISLHKKGKAKSQISRETGALYVYVFNVIKEYERDLALKEAQNKIKELTNDASGLSN